MIWYEHILEKIHDTWYWRGLKSLHPNSIALLGIVASRFHILDNRSIRQAMEQMSENDKAIFEEVFNSVEGDNANNDNSGLLTTEALHARFKSLL